MGPRLYLSSRCPHGLYEQYYSDRGFLIGEYICRHPENAGCRCLVPPVREIVCTFLSEEEKAAIEAGTGGKGEG